MKIWIWIRVLSSLAPGSRMFQAPVRLTRRDLPGSQYSNRFRLCQPVVEAWPQIALHPQ